MKPNEIIMKSNEIIGKRLSAPNNFYQILSVVIRSFSIPIKSYPLYRDPGSMHKGE